MTRHTFPKATTTLRALLLAAGCLSLASASAQSGNKSFDEFRKGVLDRYEDFRSTVFAHYADFLNGVWHEYEPMDPLRKSEEPKPRLIPSAGKTPAADPAAKLPRPAPAKPALAEPVEDAKPRREVPLAEKLPEQPARISPASPAPEAPAAAPKAPGKDIVDFYGMQIEVPRIDLEISQSLPKVSDFARHWTKLEAQKAAPKMERALLPVAKEMGLNDFLTFEFVSAWLDSKFPQASAASKMSVAHHFITYLGFNARLAVTTRTGEPIVMIPTEQKLYGITFMPLDGVNHYILGNRGVNIIGQPLATCDLPKGAAAGKKFDMLLSGLNLPRKEKQFTVSHGPLTLSGTVNENIKPVVYRYPQMETGAYAQCQLEPALRNDLVAQLKQQLDGKSPAEASAQLLSFVQEGFDYATDDDFHGFEKPYFLEENFFYPKNDCEDRAIFYTWFLWNALGVENHLLAFPGHESAALHLPGVAFKGTSYEKDGKQFFISDPTYVGAPTGMCMSRYQGVVPKVDYAYPPGK